MKWQPVIGLEVHTQLTTKSKIFSNAPTKYGASANTQACEVDLGLPGVLPVLNDAVIDLAIRFGLGSDSTINTASIFARKNYFYPDLPKGYQISQFDAPIVHDGKLSVHLNDGKTIIIGITRAHLEEDAGKSVHNVVDGCTGVDLNRAGIPLLEIVSEPEMHSAGEAVAYLKALHQLVRHLGICDGNMQEGSFRVDANVSLRPMGSEKLGTRTETKNLNSFRFVQQAIEYEIERQADILDQGGSIRQETRLFDVDAGVTRTMREKENSDDYRYFPDPDLLPVFISQARIEAVKQSLPELPRSKHQRYQDELELSNDSIEVLLDNIELCRFFEAVLSFKVSAKQAANWVLGELSGYLNKNSLTIEQSPISAQQVAELLQRLEDSTLSSKTAKIVFEALWSQTEDHSVDKIIAAKGLQQVSDTGQIETIVREIIDNNPAQVEQFRSGKDKVFGFFVGQVMKATQGKANPGQVNEILRKFL